MSMSESPLFGDLSTPESPSVIMSDLYKEDGIYVGEGVIRQVAKDGSYKVALNDNRIISCRAVSNVGESVFPKGIAVFVVVYNAEGYLLGKIRPITDEWKDDGKPKNDKSTTIGTEGDAQLRPHSLDDDTITAEVTVTRGGVVKVKSTGATGITLHPHGERIIQKSQTLLAFTDAYRIESGRTATKAGVKMDALTEETYKNKVGPSRVEVNVKNGKVDGSVVHRFAVEKLVTAGGATTGTRRFSWGIDEDGNWYVDNAKTIGFGDIADEPVVLGNQLVSLTKKLIQEMTAVRTALTTYTAAIAAAGTAAMSAGPGSPFTNAAAITALASGVTAAGTPVAAALGQSIASLSAIQLEFLTPMGPSKEAILSDFFSTQKTTPVPAAVIE